MFLILIRRELLNNLMTFRFAAVVLIMLLVVAAELLLLAGAYLVFVHVEI